MPAAEALEDLVGCLGSPGPLGVGMNRWGAVQQRRHHPPALLDAVLAREALAVADQCGVQEYFIRCRTLTALLGELHVEVDLLGLDRLVALGVDEQADSGRGIHLDDELAGLGRPGPACEPEARWPAE